MNGEAQVDVRDQRGRPEPKPGRPRINGEAQVNMRDQRGRPEPKPGRPGINGEAQVNVRDQRGGVVRQLTTDPLRGWFVSGRRGNMVLTL
jgi:hypothetical protein